MSDNKIDTEGGANVGHDVTTHEGKFVGRDDYSNQNYFYLSSDAVRSQTWEELRFWRNRVADIEQEIRQIDPRSPGAIRLSRLDSDDEVEWPHGASKILIEEARSARKRIKKLEIQLGLEPLD